SVLLARQVRRLDQLRAALQAAADQSTAARGKLTRLDVADQLAVVLVRAHRQTRGRDLAHLADDRLEQRAARTTGVPGDDEVQTDVVGLRHELRQRGQRVVALRRDQVVVVHDDEQLRTRPPGAVLQLLLGHVRTRHAL